MREQRPQFLIGEIPQSHFRTMCGKGDIVVTNFGKIKPDIQLLNPLGCLQLTLSVLLTDLYLADVPRWLSGK